MIPSLPPEPVARPAEPGAPAAPPPAIKTAADAPVQSPAPARISAGGDVILAPPVPHPSAAGDIVGLRLDSDVTQEPRAQTFGQIFAPGDVPRGDSVVARADGRDLPTQLDVKATHPDGSARMGVITVTSATPARIMLARRPGAAGGTVDLIAPPGLTVELAIGGRTVRIDLAEALARAKASGAISWWLRGPLVSEGRIDVPVTGSFHVSADIRTHADGSSMADIQFRNDIVFQPDGGSLSYGVTIGEGGAVVLHRDNLRHYIYQTWHWPVWTAGPPRANVVHDVSYMGRAGAIQNYDLTTGVSAQVVARLDHALDGPEYDVLGSSGLMKYMPTTGGRNDIGPLTGANTIWLVTQHPAAARFALAQADGSGSVPWHYFDRTTNDWVSVLKYPRLWVDGRAAKDGMTPISPEPDPASGWTIDDAHHPDLAYVPYILTGTRYYLDQLNAEASAIVAGTWAVDIARNLDKMIVTSDIPQVRARAWSLRDVNECAFINPDGSAMKNWCEISVRNSLGYMAADARRLSKGDAYGWVPGPWGNIAGAIAPWQQDFMASTIVLMAKQGVPGAKDILSWQAHYLVGRFLAGDRGFNPQHATAYGNVLYAQRDDDPFQTWAQVEAATIAAGFAKADPNWVYEEAYYNTAAIGVLGGMVSVLKTDDARRALAWAKAHLPKIGPEQARNDPTWNIVPEN